MREHVFKHPFAIIVDNVGSDVFADINRSNRTDRSLQTTENVLQVAEWAGHLGCKVRPNHVDSSGRRNQLDSHNQAPTGTPAFLRL